MDLFEQALDVLESDSGDGGESGGGAAEERVAESAFWGHVLSLSHFWLLSCSRSGFMFCSLSLSLSLSQTKPELETLANLFAQTSFFKAQLKSSLVQMKCCRMLKFKKFESGEVMFQKGDRGEEFYLIVQVRS